MRVTRAEAQESLDRSERAGPQQLRGKVAPKFLEQAEVATRHLTGRPEWDVFLQRVQALIDQEQTLILSLAGAIASPNLTNDQIFQAQRHLLASKQRVEAWELILSLPQDILGKPEEDKR